MTDRVLYDLKGGAPTQRFSPFCFRVKLALAHKDLPFRSELVGFTEKPKVEFSGQKLVPILVEGDTVVADSWRILEYLEQTYPQHELLSTADRSLPFLRAWSERALMGSMFRWLAPLIHDSLHGDDKAYFQATREARLGTTMAALAADAAKYQKVVHSTLEPLRALLEQQAFISGHTAGVGDLLVLSCLLWAEGVTGSAVTTPEDVISRWREGCQPWVQKMETMSAQAQ